MDTTGTKYFAPYSRYPLHKGQNVDNALLTIIVANSDKARMKKAVLIRGVLTLYCNCWSLALADVSGGCGYLSFMRGCLLLHKLR